MGWGEVCWFVVTAEPFFKKAHHPPTHTLPAAPQPLPGVLPPPPTRVCACMRCVACQGGPAAGAEESEVWDPGAHLGAAGCVPVAGATHAMAAVPLASMTAHLVADGCGERPPHTPLVRSHMRACVAGAGVGLPCPPDLTGGVVCVWRQPQTPGEPGRDWETLTPPSSMSAFGAFAGSAPSTGPHCMTMCTPAGVCGSPEGGTCGACGDPSPIPFPSHLLHEDEASPPRCVWLRPLTPLARSAAALL